MKLIVRADDVGYTLVHNIGTFRSFEEGISTHVDVMLDSPGTEDALLYSKAHPWLSVGWHAHLWNTPVANPKLIPSLIDERGRFKGRHDRKARDTFVYEECLIELRAELDRCIAILGRVPDTAGFHPGDSPMDRAMKAVIEEYGLVTGFMTTHGFGRTRPADEKYLSRDIICVDPSLQYPGAYSKEFDKFPDYSPMAFYKSYFTEEMFASNTTYVTPWHPGYVDELVLESSVTLARIVDVEGLCSDEMKQWIIDHKVELVTFRDAIYGTHEYQNHLKLLGSPLYIG